MFHRRATKRPRRIDKLQERRLLSVTSERYFDRFDFGRFTSTHYERWVLPAGARPVTVAMFIPTFDTTSNIATLLASFCKRLQRLYLHRCLKRCKSAFEVVRESLFTVLPVSYTHLR